MSKEMGTRRKFEQSGQFLSRVDLRDAQLKDEEVGLLLIAKRKRLDLVGQGVYLELQNICGPYGSI